MVRLVTSYDTTWNLPATWIWTVIELHVTIMAGSIPALKPLWARIFDRKVSHIITHVRRSNPTASGDAAGTPTVRSISKSSSAGASDGSGATYSTQAATLVEETITKIQTSPFSSPPRVPLKTRIANSKLEPIDINPKLNDNIPITTITSLQSHDEDRYHSPIPPPIPARTYTSSNPHHPIPQLIETRLSIQIESHPASPCLSPSSSSSITSFPPNHNTYHPNRRYYYSPTPSSTPFARPQTPTKSAAETRGGDDDEEELEEDDEELSVPPYYQYRYAYDGPRTCRTWTRVVAARTGAGGWEGEAGTSGGDDDHDAGSGSSSSRGAGMGGGGGRRTMALGNWNGKGRRWMGIGICDKQ